ncbi:MAG: ParB/RepB/Spo0J family partition protein [Nitrospinaceae bacterium]|nr:ParB/RepB/Spo0J family partition protein [Nitrospina sp.]MBT5867973.1 ParB/RepB/Spo0J family partition protein [Nitrospinaceae bacterium]MBT6345387.1 ParB/RepB/Spo0J family partition protein [Nitrospina sp.]
MNRKALGKGINALIPDFEMGVPETQSSETSQNLELLIDEISPNRFQPRKYFDDEKLAELVVSIQENGVLQPVVVQRSKDGYELIMGERRWRASKKAGLNKIPALIRDVTDAEALELAIIENIHRQDLNPIEEAESYARLSDDFAMTQEMIARKVGRSRTAVTNTLRLLKLSRNVKEDLISGKLAMGHARAMLGLDNPGQIEALRKEIFNQDLTVRQTESRVNKLKQPEITKPTTLASKKNIFIKDLEKELERKLGTKVEINPKKKGGKLVVTYYSDDDLERIQSLIGQKR